MAVNELISDRLALLAFAFWQLVWDAPAERVRHAVAPVLARLVAVVGGRGARYRRWMVWRGMGRSWRPKIPRLDLRPLLIVVLRVARCA